MANVLSPDPANWPLSWRLLLLVERLPLCDTPELTRLAGAHPGSVRRTLGVLVRDRLVVTERQLLPTRSRRYTVSPEGLRRLATLARDGRIWTRLPRSHSQAFYRSLRNRLEVGCA